MVSGIHFIHSYANPAHEQRCAEIAREIWPNRFVTLGSGILAEIREFERGSTAAHASPEFARLTELCRHRTERENTAANGLQNRCSTAELTRLPVFLAFTRGALCARRCWRSELTVPCCIDKTSGALLRGARVLAEPSLTLR